MNSKAVVALIVWYCLVPPAFGEPPVDYTAQIKPLLEARCYACHGALKQESGLRLDTGQAVRDGGDSGAIVVAGNAKASLLIERVSAEDPSERMPPEGEPLTVEQVQRLKDWIVEGAVSPSDEQPEVDPRSHWAFQLPRRSELPRAENGNSLGNPIDAFIKRRLDTQALVARPAAAKPVLLRRVYLDLIGLPPTRAELQVFLADESPDAFHRVVDRLLQSPQYGERWARHWMDVWRYSDWYGRRHVPDVWNSAPQIWRWRDWIVRSLNADKGYDQMLREMLAADEIRPEDPEAAVATGYLIRNWYALNPNDWMRNNVEHTSKAFLGLTLNCAHCHDHKYDPITQDEYFQFRAFFEPLYVRQDRAAGEDDPGPFQDYNYSTLRKIQRIGLVRVFDKNPDAPTWFYTGGDERNRVTERGAVAPGVPAFLNPLPEPIAAFELPPRAWYPGLHPEIHATVRDDLKSSIAKAETELTSARSSASDAFRERRILAAEAQVAAARAAWDSAEGRITADRARYGEVVGDASALARKAHRLERTAALRQLDAAEQSHLLAIAIAEAQPQSEQTRAAKLADAQKQLAETRAELEKARGETSMAESESYTAFSPVYPSSSTGRRKALANWITARDHPLTARVAVNHIWMRHFHSPLVDTVFDFGRNGTPPTHPALLDWLAVEFMESGWSMKRLHRLMVTSAAYQRVTAVGDASSNTALDPDNRFLWRMNTGRMEAEVLRDSLRYSDGTLDLTMGGQPLENEQALATHRRSLYYEVFPEDGGAGPMSALFDPPNPLECYRRTRSIVPQQALVLTNSQLVHEISQRLVHQWRTENGTSSLDQASRKHFITAMFERLLSRRPTETEVGLCCEAIERQQAILEKQEDATVRAYESVVRALLNHNDFVTVR